ncbi:MAG: recombinase family protein [Alphaproteobacteria bacterium]|nr:recombinase family protein [Alphaproteobacteria bacterium]
MLIGYARVSKKDDQDTVAQIRALKDAGCEEVFEETASGGRWDRPELHKMIGQLRKGDVVVVWKLDRLTRSLKDLLLLLDKLDGRGAGFKSLTESVDTTIPAGRMLTQMLGSFAEFERAMLRERTREGIKSARAAGRVGGRKPKLDDAQRREIIDTVLSGRKRAAEMARLFNVDPATVCRLIAHARQSSGNLSLAR